MLRPIVGQRPSLRSRGRRRSPRASRGTGTRRLHAGAEPEARRVAARPAGRAARPGPPPRGGQPPSKPPIPPGGPPRRWPGAARSSASPCAKRHWSPNGHLPPDCFQCLQIAILNIWFGCSVPSRRRGIFMSPSPPLSIQSSPRAPCSPGNAGVRANRSPLPSSPRRPAALAAVLGAPLAASSSSACAPAPAPAPSAKSAMSGISSRSRLMWRYRQPAPCGQKPCV